MFQIKSQDQTFSFNIEGSGQNLNITADYDNKFTQESYKNVKVMFEKNLKQKINSSSNSIHDSLPQLINNKKHEILIIKKKQQKNQIGETQLSINSTNKENTKTENQENAQKKASEAGSGEQQQQKSQIIKNEQNQENRQNIENNENTENNKNDQNKQNKQIKMNKQNKDLLVIICEKRDLKGGGNLLCCNSGQLMEVERKMLLESDFFVEEGEPYYESDEEKQMGLLLTQNIALMVSPGEGLEEGERVEQEYNVLGMINMSQATLYFAVDYGKQGNPLIAVKKFKSDDAFDGELKTYQKLRHQFQQKKLIQQLESFSCLNYQMTIEDKQEKQIKFQLGLCTLEAFTQQRAIQNIQWSLNEIKYVFQRLLNFVTFMADNGWYHGDIKPQNIVLCSREGEGAKDNQFILKMIDFGGASNQFNIQRQRTPVFFNSFLRVKGRSDEEQRKYLRKYEDKFDSQTERFITETYTVLRTIQYLFVLSEIAQDGEELSEVNNLFLLDLDENVRDASTFYWNCKKKYQTEERILKLFDAMESQMSIKSEEQPAFVSFIKMLRQDFLYGKYKNSAEIRNLLADQNIFPKEFQDNTFIQDDNNIVKTSIRQVLNKQPEIGFKKYNNDPFELLFLMDSYIVNRKVLYQGKNWDLNQFFEDFLKNDKLQFFFLNTEEGMGKTSFLRYFKTNYLQKRKKNKNLEPIMDATLDKNLCQNQEEYNKIMGDRIQFMLKEIKPGQKILVLLDECDNLRLVSKEQTYLQKKIQESLDSDLDETNNNKNNKNLSEMEQEKLAQTSQKVEYTDILAPFRKYGLDKFKIIVGSKFQDLKNFSSFIENKEQNKLGENYIQCVLQGFEQTQIDQYIQKYTNLMKRRKNFLVEEAAFFEDKQTYSRIIKENKLTDACKNPLILRIALQVLPQLEQGILDSMLVNSQPKAGILQKIKNKASLIKKGIQSKQILFKTFLKQLIIKKVVQLTVKEQFKIIGKVKQNNAKINSQTLVDLCVELIIEVNKKIAQLSFIYSRLPVSFYTLSRNKQILKMMQNPKYGELFPQYGQIDSDNQLLKILECSPLQENGTGRKPSIYQNEVDQQNTRYEFQYKFLQDTLVAEQYIKEMQYLKDSISKDNAINISKGLVKKENFNQVFQKDSFVKMKSMLIRNKELNKEEDNGVLDLVKSQSQTYFSKYWKNIYNWNIMKTTEAKMFGNNTNNIVAANSMLLNDQGEEILTDQQQQQTQNQAQQGSQQPLQNAAKTLFNNKVIKGMVGAVSGAANTFPKLNFNYNLNQITNLFNQDEQNKNQVYNGEYV